MEKINSANFEIEPVVNKIESKKYRDQLAQDLRTIEGHAERLTALKAEKDSFRYGPTREDHLTQIREKMIEQKKESIIERLNSTPLDEIIRENPELSEKFESFRLDSDFDYLSLLRTKNDPDFALLVYTRLVDSGHNSGREFSIVVPVNDEDISKHRLEINCVCGCCDPCSKCDSKIWEKEWKDHSISAQERTNLLIESKQALVESIEKLAERVGVRKIYTVNSGANFASKSLDFAGELSPEQKDKLRKINNLSSDLFVQTLMTEEESSKDTDIMVSQRAKNFGKMKYKYDDQHKRTIIYADEIK